MSEITACPLSPVADDPSAPPSLPPPSPTLLACALDASPCVPAVVLHSCTFQGIVLTWQEKSQLQICRGHRSNGRKGRRTKEPLDEGEKE